MIPMTPARTFWFASFLIWVLVLGIAAPPGVFAKPEKQFPVLSLGNGEYLISVDSISRGKAQSVAYRQAQAFCLSRREAFLAVSEMTAPTAVLRMNLPVFVSEVRFRCNPAPAGAV